LLIEIATTAPECGDSSASAEMLALACTDARTTDSLGLIGYWQ